MITTSPVSISCGLIALGNETHYLTPETYFKDAAVLWSKRAFGNNHTVFIFSHSPIKHKIGGQIAEYIRKHDLGTITVSEQGHNPIHGSHICVWTWIRNNISFAKHCMELLKELDECKSSEQKTAAPTNSTGLGNLQSPVVNPFSVLS